VKYCWMVVAVLSVLSVAEPARACRCGAPDRGFVIPEGDKLPANAAGLPWQGWPRQVENFEVVELTATGELPQSVKLLAVTRQSPASRVWPVVIVSVEGGLQPGASYRFRFVADETKRVIGARKEAVVTVSQNSVVAPSEVSLTVGPLEHRSTKISAGGSCSESTNTARRELSLELPGLDDAAKNSLFYLTLVDGKPWRVRSSICSPDALGPTWKGLGKDLLFSLCPESPRRGLKSGSSSIEMLAILPGTDLVIRSEQISVNLECQPPSDSP